MEHTEEHKPEEKKAKKSSSPYIIAVIVIILVFVSIFYVKSLVKKDGRNNETLGSQTQTEQVSSVDNTALTSGKGFATMEKPMRAFLDPLNGFTNISPEGAKGKYVLESDPNIFFICDQKPNPDIRNPKEKEWVSMPKGIYLIYPEGTDEIFFSWGKLH